MPRKVIFIINSLAGGGAERVMTTLLAHSRQRASAFEFGLVLLDDEPSAYTLPEWLKVWPLQGRGGLLESVLSLRRLLEREQPDITLSFLTRANIANAAAMAGTGRPWIISERIHTTAHLGAGASAELAKLFVRFSYPPATRVIAPSQGVGDHLVQRFGVAAERIRVIHNPFDLEHIATLAAQPAAWTPGNPFILAMGRLVDVKNFDLLLDAYAESGVNENLVIVGEGPKRASLQRRIAELGLEGRVTLPGFVSNPFALMRRAALYVLPSNAEGFPNGLVEAMAVGLPVISTDCPSGPAEILGGHAGERGVVVQAEHGVLVPTDDRPAMRDALRSMSAPETRRRYADLAKARAEAFDVASTVNAYWSVIEDALGSRAR